LSIVIVLVAAHCYQNRIVLFRIWPRVQQPYVLPLDYLHYPSSSTIPYFDEARRKKQYVPVAVGIRNDLRLPLDVATLSSGDTVFVDITSEICKIFQEG
jgi:hypothetical protein